MKNEHVEDLLQLYVEDGLDANDRDKVEAHVGVCSSCSDALAFYQELEQSLRARRGLLPDVGPTGDRVMARLGLRPARRRSWLRIPVGLPAVLSVSFVLLGVILFTLRSVMADFLTGIGSGVTTNAPSLMERLNHALGQFAGINQIAVMAIYFGVFGLIFFTGSMMVLRFVRD